MRTRPAPEVGPPVGTASTYRSRVLYVPDTILIQAARIVTMEPGRAVLDDHDLLIRGQKIVEIGTGLQAPAGTEVMDGRGRVVIPGLIDTHRHLWQTTLRGSMPNCTLGEYFGRIMIGTAPHLSPADVNVSTLLGAYELLNAGVTSVVDWANITNTPDHADAGIQALRDAGIRATYAYGWPGGADHLVDSTLPHPADAARVASVLSSTGDAGGADLIGFALALRGPASNGPEELRGDWALARELSARITLHAGMRTRGQDRHDVDTLAALGLMTAETTYVHCNSLSDDELRRVRDSGASTSVSAYCESVMGHGRPPTARMVALGMVPSLSADVGVSVPGDMFSHMRATWTNVRADQLAAPDAGAGTPLTTVHDVLAMATLAGAEAMGTAATTGSIAVGKQADLVVLRAQDVNTMLVSDPVAMTVGHADTSNVETVLVAGRVVKRDGHLVGVDLDALRQRATESRSRILSAVAAAR